MNPKQNTRFQTIVRYVRDLSIVVAGIAVTLYASDRVSGRSEKRDLKLYLNAIKLEIEENIKTLDEAIEDLQPSIKYSNYLRSHDKESLDKDSIKCYQAVYHSFYSYSVRTNAFEMFKSSGTMRLVNDKELLLSLWEVYDEFTSVKETFEWFLPVKWEDIKKELSMLIDGQKLKPAPMYHFYFAGMPSLMLQPCEDALKKAKEMVEKLEVRP
jgi:hypothetical protein